MARYEDFMVNENSEHRQHKSSSSNWLLRRLKFDFWNKPIDSLANVLLWIFVFFPVLYGLFYGDRIPQSEGFQAGSSALGSVGNRVFGEVLQESKPMVDQMYIDQLNGNDAIVPQFNNDAEDATR